MASRLIPLLRHGDRAALARELAPCVRFHSPVADYEGLSDVAHLLWLIAAVLDDVRPTRELTEPGGVTTFISAEVNAQALDGVLDEHMDESGRVAEATLLLRPLVTLQVAIEAMREGLAADPLPSRRT